MELENLLILENVFIGEGKHKFSVSHKAPNPSSFARSKTGTENISK